MNKHTDKLLQNGITVLVKRLESTEKFVLAQAPEICKQIIKEQIMANLVDLITPSLFLILCIIAIHEIFEPFYLIGQNFNDCGPTALGFLKICLGITGVVCFCDSLSSLTNIAKHLLTIIYCPKLVLLRTFKKLLRK